jgi:hypothetical protein
LHLHGSYIAYFEAILLREATQNGKSLTINFFFKDKFIIYKYKKYRERTRDRLENKEAPEVHLNRIPNEF